MFFIQVLINSLVAGAIYALIATGFSLIYSTCKFIHFAHGVVMLTAGYILFSLFQSFRLDFLVASLGAILGAGLLGFLCQVLVYNPLYQRKASSFILFVSSLVVLSLIEAVLLLVYGTEVRTISLFEHTRGIDIFGAYITTLQIIIIAISILVYFILRWFMHSTKIGKTLRAVSNNPQLSESIGISVNRMYQYVFIIGSLSAGIGGVLLALEQNLSPTMGPLLMVKGFTGAIIGGLGGVPGSVVGSYILGFTENFAIIFLPSEFKDAISFALLFICLLYKPKGLFSK